MLSHYLHMQYINSLCMNRLNLIFKNCIQNRIKIKKGLYATVTSILENVMCQF